jgi:P4 family phage/plasmid primase-like protien
MLALKQYFAQVLPRAAVREYVLKLFATFLHGSVKEQKFNIWTGSGSNGKSLSITLFEKAFGDYCCKFPITLLTQKRAASNAATSELARAKGKRFASLQEPSEGEHINCGLMKELSGGDKIMARSLFKEPIEFVPQFKMLLLCNHLPHVPSDDGGTWRRIRVVEFTSKFVDNPIEDNEYPIDYDLPNKLDSWRSHFMALLLEYYKLYKVEGITEPEEVLKCTNEYKRQNDHLAEFIHTCIEKKDSKFMYLNDAFAELKNWVKDDNIPIKIPTKAELEKYFTRQGMGRCIIHNNLKAFKGYQVKCRYQTSTDDHDDGF